MFLLGLNVNLFEKGLQELVIHDFGIEVIEDVSHDVLSVNLIE